MPDVILGLIIERLEKEKKNVSLSKILQLFNYLISLNQYISISLFVCLGTLDILCHSPNQHVMSLAVSSQSLHILEHFEPILCKLWLILYWNLPLGQLVNLLGTITN